ncbi:hypothetical protein SAMN05660841_03076 [Sphingobacterium nematocida]|uniref:Uncharacterized protein n=1 Tax=Sphingobacterium nematocida TaxID=1513896 RepID=A0A1T5F6H4_9SPHI|nr:hypothetical protein [Sphingobacterium nematocida]SKB91731.1 hypothetical protein SAMN05660841_03076 [Sphingobacterium nematocida]
MNTVPILRNFVVLIIAILLLSSCVSRLIRPSLIGTIVDFDGNPVENCTVGSAKTDKYGYFKLAEIRKNRFFFTEVFAMEAPSIFVSEHIHKDGYKDEKIEIFHKYGGGLPKGTQWSLDSIHIMESSFDDYAKLLQNSWIAVDVSDENALYLLRHNFKERCKTKKCNIISNKLYPYINKSSGDTMAISTHLNLKENGQMDVVKIRHYGYKSSSAPDFKANDTLRTWGKWSFKSNNLLLSSDFKEINGNYLVSEAEYVGYNYIILRRFEYKEVEQSRSNN